MKLKKGDKVMVISGRDRGKKGEIMRVFPDTNMAVVAEINLVSRHTKPNAKNPKGGILRIEKPINASKLAALDSSGKPARIGYKISDKGEKIRIYKTSKFTNKKVATAKPKTEKVSK